jgi:hypothetical protein
MTINGTRATTTTIKAMIQIGSFLFLFCGGLTGGDGGGTSGAGGRTGHGSNGIPQRFEL